MRTERFLLASAPPALIARVRMKMAGVRRLKLDGAHSKARAAERAAPAWLNEPFDATQWDLVSVEVRTTTGRFVSTAWERTVRGERWRVVIGLHDAVQTFIDVDPDVPLRASPVGQEFFDFVERVNRDLLERDAAIVPQAKDSDALR